MINIANLLNELVLKQLAQHLLRTFIFISLLSILSGCNDRLDVPIVGDDVPEGMVRVNIHSSIESAGIVTTRTAVSDADRLLQAGNIFVLVFDGMSEDASLLQQPVLATFSAGASGDADKLTAVLNQQTIDCYLHVVANLSLDEQNYLATLVAGAKKGAIATTLKHKLKPTPENYIASPLPMSGISSATKLQKSAALTPLTVSIPLSRSVARIDIDGSTPNFTVYGASVANGAPYGFTMAQTVLPMFSSMDVTSYKQIDNAPASTSMQDLLFCFENSGSTDNSDGRATRVIIYGKPTGSSAPSYYPIDIIYSKPGSRTGETLSDIERNKCYKIVLNKVDKNGYRSIEEAARSEAFNTQLDMSIVVTDPYAHDITTNGKQFLGVTNSEFVLYPRAQTVVNDVHISSFSYTCDLGWTAGIIECFDQNGAKNTLLKLSTGVTGRMEVSSGVTVRDVIVDIAPTFTSGTVVLHIGNLRKEIKVRRMTLTNPVGEIYSNYFLSPNTLSEFKVGEIIAPSVSTSWLKVSRHSYSGGGSSHLNDREVNPDGGIYIHAEGNLSFDGSSIDREASLYVSGDKDDQRIKVLVQQAVFDVYTATSGQILPYSYVGTFHRWDEMGERLIRIKAQDPSVLGGSGALESDVWWQADVVAGREFIVLDKEVSKDPGVHIWNGATVNWNGQTPADNPTWATSGAIESASGDQGLVGSLLRSVKGVGTNIYFRVGLTGRLNSPQAQPRYGLIVISYGHKNDPTPRGKHSIYVRQGEAADYLMRPWDPSTTHPKGWYEYKYSTRPQARKFTPYHLTDPDGGSNVVDQGKNGYEFVDYPSQGGFFFPSSGTQAINPTVSGGQSFPQSVPAFDVSNPWKTDWETCPRGYRRPLDGIGRTYADKSTTPSDPTSDGAFLYPNDIVQSEVRQSLWLYPLHGGYKSDFTNQLRGYLADGYFDRRKIELTPSNVEGNTGSRRYAIVNPGSVEAAYWGFLVFNPHNYASIFFPLNGYYRHSFLPFGVFNLGRDGNLQTSTPGLNSNEGWVVGIGYFEAYGVNTPTGWVSFPAGWVFDMYTKSSNNDGYSVRCVKDEETIVSTQPGTGNNGAVIEDVVTPVNPNTASQLAIRHLYTGSSGTLQSQIEADYDASKRSRINSIAISGDRPLSTVDFAYLNAWASKSSSINGVNYSSSILRHLIIRGKGNYVMPANAFTSPLWSSVLLMDAKTIQTGAFALGVGVNNLTLGSLDPITIQSNAFAFDPSKVQLHLLIAGDEYGTADLTAKTWKGFTWQAIKGE